MKLLLPFNIPTLAQSVTLPVIIFQNEATKISLKEFSIADREMFFGLEGLEVTDTEVKARHSQTITGYRVFNDYHEYLNARYQFIVEMDTNNPALLQRFQYELDFACRVTVGHGCRIAKFIGGPSMTAGATLFLDGHIISHRKIEEINEEKLARIRQINSISLSRESDPKVKLLKVFLNTAMRQVPNAGISGALYVSILESLFVPEKDGEIRYRFSLRLTKKRVRDTVYQSRIKELYDKRSTIFHGGGDQFTQEDLKFVEEEACWAIEEYLTNPESFSRENLDRMLLERA